MPLYNIVTQAGVLDNENRALLAQKVTALHSEYSGVPKEWVHIIFQEYPPLSGFTAGEPSPPRH